MIVPSFEDRNNPGPDAESAGLALRERREFLAQRLAEGATGGEIISSFTEWVDRLIVGKYRNEARQLADQGHQAPRLHCSALALGGFGRRELAPYSDIDIMFLYRPQGAEVMEQLSKGVLHYLWDLGFQVGHSVRTIPECLQLGLADLSIRTSLLEARYLAGDADLFQEFQRRFFEKIGRRRPDQFIQEKVDERIQEYKKFGETVYLLEPNVKKSQGGLRDLHLIQWIANVKYRAATIQELADQGKLSRQDYTILSEAREFLWRVRLALHLHAGMAQEILSFDDQVWIAQQFGFQDLPNLLAVEQCMQQYYRHTRGLHETLDRFIERSRPISLRDRVVSWLPAKKIGEHFTVKGQYLTVDSDRLTQVLSRPDLLLQLFECAQRERLKIETSLLDDIHEQMMTVSDQVFCTQEASGVFRRILSAPWGVASTLEAMHRAYILEKIIPVFSRVRGLMQFNQYHKYTVDEHSLLAVQKAEDMAREDGFIKEVYKDIHRKDVLLLAILLHDLGKGLEDDHSEVGQAIAKDMALRLGLNEQETEMLVFLVYRHLLMAHIAFRRDPFDKKVLLPFARKVKTPQVLRMLLVLTAADLAAVGPDVLTKWKESLLIQAFTQALLELSGPHEGDAWKERIHRVAQEIAAVPTLDQLPQTSEQWLEQELSAFPLRYIQGTTPDRIAAHLAAIIRLQQGEVVVEDSYDAKKDTSEYTVIAHSSLTPGLFSKITGVMASLGLRILDAQIVTRHDGVVLDSFQVKDPDYSDRPPDSRRKQIISSLEDVMRGGERIEELLSQNHRLSLERTIQVVQPIEVTIDNETSDEFTIVDVFAEDCQGLLYTIAHSIFTLGLSVHLAKISTRLDQVADVFHVTELSGAKVHDGSRLETIRSTLIRDIEQRLEKSRRREPCVS